MEYLFNKDIHNWSSWGAIFQSIDDFRELIKGIFIKENLFGYDKISNLTPGTNAVFKVDKYVIKIFAPKESGANMDNDYNAEIDSMRRAISRDINTPNIIGASYIQDRYLFRYIIMDCIDGKEAGSIIKGYSPGQKHIFVCKLKQNICKLNTEPPEKVNMGLIRSRAVNNSMKWDGYSDIVKTQVADILTKHDFSCPVYVHGDITADNVMIDINNDIFIIDFADSKIAPVEYEYPPVIFDLFDFDREMVSEFVKDIDYDDFIEKLFIGTLLHDYGHYFLKLIYKRCADKDISELSDINEIKELIHSEFLPK